MLLSHHVYTSLLSPLPTTATSLLLSAPCCVPINTMYCYIPSMLVETAMLQKAVVFVPQLKKEQPHKLHRSLDPNMSLWETHL